jgi:hypothetical protein
MPRSTSVAKGNSISFNSLFKVVTFQNRIEQSVPLNQFSRSFATFGILSPDCVENVDYGLQTAVLCNYDVKNLLVLFKIV